MLARASKRVRGLSMIEVMVSTGVLALVFVGFAGLSGPASRAMETDVARFDARARATRALERIARSMRCVALSSLKTVPDGFESAQPVQEDVPMDDFNYRAYVYDPLNPDDVPVLWPDAAAGPCTVALEPTLDDPVDGVDDDDDGVIDDRDLVLHIPGQPAERLLGRVSAGSFRLSRRTLHLTVTVTVRAASGVLVSESASIKVEIRND